MKESLHSPKVKIWYSVFANAQALSGSLNVEYPTFPSLFKWKHSILGSGNTTKGEKEHQISSFHSKKMGFHLKLPHLAQIKRGFTQSALLLFASFIKFSSSTVSTNGSCQQHRSTYHSGIINSSGLIFHNKRRNEYMMTIRLIPYTRQRGEQITSQHRGQHTQTW